MSSVVAPRDKSQTGFSKPAASNCTHSLLGRLVGNKVVFAEVLSVDNSAAVSKTTDARTARQLKTFLGILSIWITQLFMLRVRHDGVIISSAASSTAS